MTEFFADSSRYADNLRWIRGRDLVNQNDGTYDLIKVPQYHLVAEVRYEQLSPYGSTSVITVGWLGNQETADPDGFLTSAEIDPDGTGIMISSLKGAQPAAGGKWFNVAPGAITLTLTKGNAAATAACRVWACLVRIH